ncbi:DUF3472 domain-containing protein [Draconibacterium sp. IB214405]|uniref:DUF3472 domain-containing protein n=1 Tax=Draconibacterium sp. IB214405 TaxID=3097352 RepID=UPI002A16FEED|nr:DUF3472 domain-containing protein [Draconibacterium sp. IB214405]MDX8340693.1 DUF3472 domain-containing protein [Draconibacterium sp. IB214405]
MTLKNMNKGIGFLALLLIVLLSACSSGERSVVYTASLPVEGNTWTDSNKVKWDYSPETPGSIILPGKNEATRTYFWTEQTGEIHIGFSVKAVSENVKVVGVFNGEETVIELTPSSSDSIYMGSYSIDTPGYNCVELYAHESNGQTTVELEAVLLGGAAVQEGLQYVKDDFYWGRRGPSVHLSYQIPEEAGDIEYFYNEITVPKGQDVLGSYFMANGFGEGYFGIQVNSPTERRILFSVWSPFKTNNPNEIPEDQRINLLKKGESVYTGKFGNEGSGGQSYLKYNWKAGVTYGFLLKAKPSENNSTIYTAWFMDPEVNDWQLIASFRRPQTSTYVKRPHSFLENFIPQMGTQSRMAYYNNQWVCNTEGQWYELTEAKFTADATARKGARQDYAGGVLDGKFFMKNCGFFNERVAFDQYFEREKQGEKPVIEFNKLK